MGGENGIAMKMAASAMASSAWRGGGAASKIMAGSVAAAMAAWRNIEISMAASIMAWHKINRKWRKKQRRDGNGNENNIGISMAA
jgi:hypothetical protein